MGESIKTGAFLPRTCAVHIATSASDKYLVKDLRELNLWDTDMKQNIIANFVVLLPSIFSKIQPKSLKHLK